MSKKKQLQKSTSSFSFKNDFDIVLNYFLLLIILEAIAINSFSFI
ncbi:hypothetical protein Pf1_00180 [Flavobacterium columnare]|nr:hypothetical protein Pf1_00180 [Flavobacterium columnare]